MADNEGWVTVENKKKKSTKKKSTSTSSNVSYNNSFSAEAQNVDHQQWAPKVFQGGNHHKKVLPSVNNTMSKGVSNKQHPQNVNATKVEKKVEEGDLSHKKISHDLRQKIQQARMAKRWNQEELANHSQVPLSDVKNYEKGVGIPDPQVLQKLSKALGVPLSTKN